MYVYDSTKYIFLMITSLDQDFQLLLKTNIPNLKK